MWVVIPILVVILCCYPGSAAVDEARLKVALLGAVLLRGSTCRTGTRRGGGVHRQARSRPSGLRHSGLLQRGIGEQDGS